MFLARSVHCQHGEEREVSFFFYLLVRLVRPDTSSCRLPYWALLGSGVFWRTVRRRPWRWSRAWRWLPWWGLKVGGRWRVKKVRQCERRVVGQRRGYGTQREAGLSRIMQCRRSTLCSSSCVCVTPKRSAFKDTKKQTVSQTLKQVTAGSSNHTGTIFDNDDFDWPELLLP